VQSRRGRQLGLQEPYALCCANDKNAQFGSVLTKGKPTTSKPARDCSPEAAAEAFELLEGRWKLMIIHQLFGPEGSETPVRRFLGLERAIPAVSQKMLIQQLRRPEQDGIVQRTIHPQVPPKV